MDSFLKKHPKTATSTSRSQNEKKLFFALSTIRSCLRLLGEHVQIVLQS
jgi:hypothetical protein